MTEVGSVYDQAFTTYANETVLPAGAGAMPKGCYTENKRVTIWDKLRLRLSVRLLVYYTVQNLRIVALKNHMPESLA